MKTNSELSAWLETLWKDYAAINPQAKAIHKLLTDRGEVICNDHIALRGFSGARAGIDALARPFLKLGYTPKASYKFPKKNLFARYFHTPDKNLPKVFISEFLVENASKRVQELIRSWLAAAPEQTWQRQDLPIAGQAWAAPSFSEYEEVRRESEYAAWMGAFGFRVNHFTVLCNGLKTFSSLAELNEFLKQSGYAMNQAGGELKGTPKEMLEQSSTLASPVMMKFSDGDYKIPGCYYEFAMRYADKTGERFEGFLPESADKIFESTNKNF